MLPFVFEIGALKVLTDVVVVEVAALVEALDTATCTFRIGAPRLIVF